MTDTPWISLRLPWPPALNHIWRHVVINGAARVLLSAEGRKYRQAVIAEVAKQAPEGLRTLSGAISVRIGAYPPDRRRRDVDGLAKAPLDALTHARVWDDDSQIRSLLIEMLEPSKGSPGLNVTISTQEAP